MDPVTRTERRIPARVCPISGVAGIWLDTPTVSGDLRRGAGEIYTTLPKATPETSAAPTTQERVREDVIDTGGTVTLHVNGRLHHIGLGRTHKGTRVKILAQDLRVRVINATTGQILRELTIDPDRDYQPQPPK